MFFLVEKSAHADYIQSEGLLALLIRTLNIGILKKFLLIHQKIARSHSRAITNNVCDRTNSSAGFLKVQVVWFFATSMNYH